VPPRRFVARRDREHQQEPKLDHEPSVPYFENESQNRPERAALDALGDPCRELIELRYFGDLSYDEMARAQGITAKAIGARLHRCLVRLAEHVNASTHRGQMPTKAV
jgi:RNA polymerase sigma factor (sigma-70 family)